MRIQAQCPQADVYAYVFLSYRSSCLQEIGRRLFQALYQYFLPENGRLVFDLILPASKLLCWRNGQGSDFRDMAYLDFEQHNGSFAQLACISIDLTFPLNQLNPRSFQPTLSHSRLDSTLGSRTDLPRGKPCASATDPFLRKIGAL